MFQRICVVFFSHIALIKIGSYPRMHDQFAYREAVKDIHQIVELIRIIVAETSLNRYLQVSGNGIGVDVIEELLKRKGLREEPRAFALRANGSRRTAEIL